MDGSVKCIKYLLFAFNLLFALTGLILIVTGSVIQGVYSQYLDFLGSKVLNAPVLLIAVGCLIFVITFFGCCGAIKESHCMTLTFAVLLAVIFLIEVGAGIGAYSARKDVRGTLERHMERGLQNYGRKEYRGVTETWNVVQHELKCCGAQEYRDWVNTTFSSTDGSVPDSCCLSDIEGCGHDILNMSKEQAPMIIYPNGCLEKLQDIIVTNIATIGGVGIGIAMLQFVGIVFACILARTIKKEYEIV